MEGLTRLVSESLARYGLDRPVDYRRLQWSRWFRCESLHSLLHVPSKPGIFAVAEEIMEFGSASTDAGTTAQACPEQDAALKRRNSAPPANPALVADESRRMLSVLQFREDDDMAFVLDRMLSAHNPMSACLATGKCFVRFVVIEDEVQRRSICNALNQWLVSTGDKVSGVGAHFATSLEVVARAPSPANADTAIQPAEAHTPEVKEVKKVARQTSPLNIAAHLDSGAAANIHCPQPFPSGF